MAIKDKNAWIRILEAFISILIVFSAVLFISEKNFKKPDISKDIYETQGNILDVISRNNSLREIILDDSLERENNPEINNFISKLIPKSWGFATKICDIDKICNTNTPNDKEIFVSERLISATLDNYSPKKLVFFVWIKD